MSATDPKNLVWSPVNDGASVAVQYSKDGAATWNPVVGLPSDTFQRFSAWLNGQTLASDRVNGNKFYYYYQSTAGAVGFYRSTDGGANWTKTAANMDVSGVIKWSAGVMLKANPFVEGDLWLTFTPSDSSGFTGKLFHSTDGGDSFQAVAAFQYALNVALGKGSAAGKADIYVFGGLAGTAKLGLYQSLDNGAAWELITNPTELGFGNMRYLEADQLNENRVYIATGGRGIFYGVKAN
jgi:hypothetical protein